MKNNSPHLNEELFLMSIVDKDALSPENRKHLEECSACAEKKNAILQGLNGLGDTARELCPAGPLPTRWKQVGAPRANWWSQMTIPRPVYALAGTMAIVLMTLVLFQDSGSIPPGDNSSYDLAQVYLPQEYIFVETMLTDDPENTIPHFADTLEVEVYEMAETYVSADFQYLAGESPEGTGPELSDSPTPPDSDQPITLHSSLKGVVV